jgi:hypothetical protein
MNINDVLNVRHVWGPQITNHVNVIHGLDVTLDTLRKPH